MLYYFATHGVIYLWLAFSQSTNRDDDGKNDNGERIMSFDSFEDIDKKKYFGIVKIKMQILYHRRDYDEVYNSLDEGDLNLF